MTSSTVPLASVPTLSLETVFSLQRLAAARDHVWSRVMRGQAHHRSSSRQLTVDLESLHQQIHAGEWKPNALHAVHIDDGERELQIPMLQDRVVHRALYEALVPHIESTLHPSSFAYRPGRGVGAAVRTLQDAISSGKRHLLQLDIAHCFDSVTHDAVHAALDTRCELRPRLRDFVAQLLSATVLRPGWRWQRGDGLAQGSPLSPLFSNVVLDALDRAVDGPTRTYLRYGDDIIVAAASASELATAEGLVRTSLSALGFTAKLAKTARRAPHESFGWLGMWFVDGVPRIAQTTQSDIAAAVGRIGWQAAGAAAVADAWVDEDRTLDALTFAGVPGVYAVASRAARDGDTDALRAAANGRATTRDVAPIGGVHARLCRWWLTDASPEAHAAFWMDALLESEVRGDDARAVSERLGVPNALADAQRDLLAFRRALAQAGWPALADAVPSLAAVEPATSQPVLWAQQWAARTGGIYWDRAGGGRDKSQAVLDVAAAWSSHLQGRRRVRVRVLRPDGTTGIGVVRIAPTRDGHHLVRRALHAGGDARAILHRQEQQCLKAAWRVAQASEDDGVTCRVLRGSDPGVEIWWWFDTPLPSTLVAQLLARYAQHADQGIAPDDRVWRVMRYPLQCAPKQKRGPSLVAPFGVHAATQRAGAWIHPAPEQPRDVGPWLQNAATSSERAKQVVTVDPRIEQPGNVVLSDQTATRIAEGCPVIREIVEQAARLGRMSPRRKRTLAEVARGLSEETGRRVLQSWYAPAGADRDAASRALRGAPAPPLSCPKIRERHADVTSRVPCACVFEDVPEPAYPSPVLYVMQGEQLAERVTRAKQVGGRPQSPARSAAPPNAERAATSGKSSPNTRSEARPPKLEAPAPAVAATSPQVVAPTPSVDRGSEQTSVLRQFAEQVRAAERATDRAIREREHHRSALAGACAALGVREVRLSGGVLKLLQPSPPRFVWVPDGEGES